MKKFIKAFVCCLLVISSFGCGKKNIKPSIEISEMKNIAELATIECYYHNVAKYDEVLDVEWYEFWKKGIKHFWIEYSAIAYMGIDASLLKVEINNNKVTITMPEAKVIKTKVDPISLSKDSFFIDNESANITAENEKLAFQKAQQDMRQIAENDKNQLEKAQKRVQELLAGYIHNMEKLTNINYEIEWNIIPNETVTVNEN